jgi:GNAT superfamily N-acetyltransferase
MTQIREASPGDERAIFDLIYALAVYEKAPEQVTNTPAQLRIDLFEDEICCAFVAEDDGQIIGFSLYYISYSTWKGKCLYLEDFFVIPEKRHGGIGAQLFRKTVEKAKELGVKRMDWQVLEWNEPALAFYKKQHATLDEEWVTGRLFFE